MRNKYKDSKVQWIGEVPIQWDIKRIKRFAQVKRGASPRPIDDSKYFDDNGEYAWVRIADVSASGRYLKKTTQVLSKIGASLSVKQNLGDLFISIAGTVGKPIITKIKCCIHDGFIWFDNPKFNKDFLYYIFLSEAPYQGLGKLGTQLNLNTDTIGQIFIPVPSNKEQHRIAAYLDKICAVIDKAIEAKQKQLETLDALRKSIIHKAVTRGLDDSVELKDTGVEWLGKIPRPWDVRRIKSVADIRYGLGQPPAQKDDGIPMVRATNVSAGKITDKDLIYVDPRELPPGRNPYLKEGEIIVVRSGAYTGDSAIIPKRYAGAVVGYDMVITVTQTEPRFLAYSLLSDYVLNSQILLLTLRAAQPHLNAHELGGVRLSLPETRTEQREICDYLDLKLAELASITATIDAQISTLEQYRKSLIHECVTGKRRITEDYVQNQL